ncbi:hypothetical protein [Pseudomonas eucalypticola]|nr:hypothetical protein [Pseudomonas eucalypticola]
MRLTLVQYHLEQGHSDQAARLQAELAAINPDDPALVAPARP